MPLSAKVIHALGFLAIEEASYGAGGTPSSATDGIQLAYDSPEGAPVSYTEEFDGSLGDNPGGIDQLAMIAPSQRVLSGTLPFHLRGAGAAYGASVIPSLHTLLKSSGLDATLDATVGFEKWTYTPTRGPTGYTSLAASVLAAGELWPATHLLSNWKCTIDQGAPKHEFDIAALLGDPSDSLEAYNVVYPLLTVAPPKAESVVVNIGSYVIPEVVSAEWDLGRSFDEARLRITGAGGHAGFSPGKIAPRLTITLERTALVGSPFHTAAGLDPYRLRNLVTQLGVSLAVGGSAQYNRYKWTLPKAQLADSVEGGAEGSAATWKLVFAPFSSTPIANNSFAFDMD